MHVRHEENKVDIHTVRYEKTRQSCMLKKSRDEICNRETHAIYIDISNILLFTCVVKFFT